MASQVCMCAVLKHQNASLQSTIRKLLGEIQELKTKNGKFRRFISEMKLLWEMECGESSGSDSNCEDGEEELIYVDLEGEADDIPRDSDRVAMNGNSFSSLPTESVDVNSSDRQASGHRSGASIPCEPIERVLNENEAPEVYEAVSDEEEEESETDDESSLELSDVDEQTLVGALTAKWKCTECQKQITGHRHQRLMHIAMHKNFKLTCPFRGCDKLYSLQGLKYSHIQRAHQSKLQKLSKYQQKRFRKERAKCLKKSKEFEREFFPLKNIAEVIKLDNEICKKCSATVTSRQGQNDHVASHLKRTILCPVPECSKQSSLGCMYEHVRNDHAPLSQEVQLNWVESKKIYQNAVAEAKNSYF